MFGSQISFIINLYGSAARINMEVKNTELIKCNSGTQVSSPVISRRSESAGKMTAQKKKTESSAWVKTM